MRYLLDTDAIIDYLVGIPTSVALVQDLHQRGGLLCVCDVVIAEVYAGVRPKDRDKVQRLLQACQFLATTQEVARQAGEWRYTYARQGVTLSTTDTLVAATAQAHQASLITGNKDDYPMPEVTVLPLLRAN